MDISIVVRTAEPARAAEIARALGIDVKDPNRPNPRSWTFDRTVSIVITTAEGQAPGIFLGPRGDFDEGLGVIRDILGAEAVAVSDDGRTASIKGLDGLRIAVERDAPRTEHYYEPDIGKGVGLRYRLEANRDRVAACLRDVGASDPRLVGEELGRLRGPVKWAFVVNAAETANLQPLQELLDEFVSSPVQVMRSSEFDPVHLALINRKAFDV